MIAGRSSCPDKYCGYEPEQMDGMDPAVRFLQGPMVTPIRGPNATNLNNNGWSQGTSSAAFLKGANWGIYEGRLATGVLGIGFGGTPIGQRIDMVALPPTGWVLMGSPGCLWDSRSASVV